MADVKAGQKVRIWDGTSELGELATAPFFVRLTDGTDGSLIDGSGNLNVILATNSGVDIGDVDVLSVIPGTGATNLGKAEDAAHTTGDTGVMALAVRNDAGAALAGLTGDYIPLSTDSSGNLRTTGSFTANAEKAEDAVHASGDTGNFVLAVRNDVLAALAGTDGDYAPLQVDADGALYATIRDGGNSITVDAVDLDIRDLTSVSDSVAVLQATHDNLNANANIQVADADVSVSNPVPVSATGAANTELNPIFVQVVTTAVSAEEVQDFNTVAAVASDGTSNHDVTIAGTTGLLKSVIVSASSAGKWEIQTGPLASLATDAVVFTTEAKPTEQVFFDPPIELTGTTPTIRIIRTNRDNQAQDLYSTVIANDI